MIFLQTMKKFLKSRANVLFLAGVAIFLALSIWGAKPDAKALVLLSGAALLAVAGLCWRAPWSRVFAGVVVFLWALNAITTVLCKVEYNGMPSAYMAESVLATNPHEARGMISDHLEYVFLFLILFGGAIALAWQTSKRVPVKLLRWGAGFFAVFVVCLIAMYAVRHRGDVLQMAIRTTTKTPFYHAASFLAVRSSASGNHGTETSAEISGDVAVRETGIDTYVLVIGESARRKNMGIYGAARDTTPNETAETARMLLFTQAISPAGNTIESIPRTLRPVDADGNLSKNCKDCIITLANRAGYHTAWISNQEDYNPNYAVITEIMKQSTEVSWKSESYDESLLGKLDATLKKPGKKMIILHFRGSHEPPGEAFPKAYATFSGGNSREDDYDNSIYYTDVVLGKIFERLRGEKASLLYYSDHALIRKKKLWYWNYRHGGGVKEAYEVPLWIWYSPAVKTPGRTGVIDSPYSTKENYYLLRDWLGIDVDGKPPVPTPLRDGWQPSEIYVDGKLLFSGLPRE